MVHRDSRVIKAECASEGKGFSGKTGLLGRIRMGGDRKKALSLIEKEMRNGRSASHMGEALTLFAELSAPHKLKLMKDVQARLCALSAYPFESPEKAHSVKVAADFLAATAKQIPENEDGERKGFDRAMRALADVVEHIDPHGEEENFPEVKNACAAALWELGYPSFEFWEEHVEDPVVQSTVVDKLLGHDEPLDDFESHGWSILIDKMKGIAPALLRSGSPKKEDFLRFILNTGDPDMMAFAFIASATLEGIPDDFRELMDGLPMDHPAKAAALDLAQISKLAGDARKGDVFAVLELIDLCNTGRRQIGPVLDRIAMELEGETDPERRDVAGYISSRIDLLLDRGGEGDLQDAVDDLLDSGSELSNEVLRHELYFCQQHVAQSASAMKVRFLLDATNDENPYVVADALSSAALLPDIPQKFLEIAYGIMKDESRKPIHGVAYGFVDSYYINKVRKAVAESQESKGEVIGMLRKMVNGNDLYIKRAGFVAALHLQEHASLSVINAAHDVLKREENESMRLIAEDFLKLHHLIRQAEKPGNAQFMAVRELTRLYTQNRPYLYPILYDLATEMSDVFHDPGGQDSHEKRYEKAAALYALWHLTNLGIPCSRDINPQAVVNVLLEHVGEGGWELIREDAPHIASLIARSDTVQSVDFLMDMARDADAQTAEFALQIASMSKEKMFLIRDAAYEILEDPGRQGLHQVADEFLTISYINLAKENGEGKVELFRELLEEGNRLEIGYAFAAALYLSEIPEDFVSKAREMAGEDTPLGRQAQVFLDALPLKEQLCDADTCLGAIPPLAVMYMEGAHNLGPMLLDEAVEIGQEIRKGGDMVHDPALADALRAFMEANIPVPGIRLERIDGGG